MNRNANRLATGLAAAVAAFCVLTTGPGAAPTPTLFVSPSGSDAGRCSHSRPCRTLDRAYRVAGQRAIIELAGGSYPAQSIDPDPAKKQGAHVVFRSARGAMAKVTGELSVKASHLEFRRLVLSDLDFKRSANDVTVRNVTNHGLWIAGSSNIRFIGITVSCGVCAFHSHIENGGPDSRPPRNILFDRVNFHDWHSVSGEHTECLQILGGDGITIRNSVFRRCGTAKNGLGATGDLFLGFLGGSGAVTKNVLVENNFFYPSGNPFAIQMSDLKNVRFRYNSIAGPVIIFDREGSGRGIEFTGNVMRFSGCTAESNGVPIAWRYNVMSGGKCGRSDRRGGSGFVNSQTNLHLRPGSPAVNAGNPKLYPKRDIDGQRRPRGGRPDAGADERR